MRPTIEYPLKWPQGWIRTYSGKRTMARWKNVTWRKEQEELANQFEQMGITIAVITSDVELRQDGNRRVRQASHDPGVAVYFFYFQTYYCIACDRWDNAEHNLMAICKTIESLRIQCQSWGVGDLSRVLSAYKVDPPKKEEPKKEEAKRGEQHAHSRWQKVNFSGTFTTPAWATILGVTPFASPDEVKTAYRNLAMKTHPDHGGSAEEFIRIKKAYDSACKEKGWTP